MYTETQPFDLMSTEPREQRDVSPCSFIKESAIQLLYDNQAVEIYTS